MSENVKVFTVSAEDYHNRCCKCWFLIETFDLAQYLHDMALEPSERKPIKIRCGISEGQEEWLTLGKPWERCHVQNIQNNRDNREKSVGKRE